MLSVPAVLLIVLFGAALVAEEKSPPSRWTKEDLGKLPSGWRAQKTGKGDGSVWKVVADTSAPSKSGLVLAQTAASPARLFNLCVAKEGRYRDVEVQVAFKAVRGKEDQGGGIVWRYQDANNSYVCWLNGKKYLDVKDKTFPKAGKIGLWTKADAQTYFDDLRVTVANR